MNLTSSVAAHQAYSAAPRLRKTLLCSARARSDSLCFFSSRRRNTSYIVDWSSDVCSSDLLELRRNQLSDELDICHPHGFRKRRRHGSWLRSSPPKGPGSDSTSPQMGGDFAVISDCCLAATRVFGPDGFWRQS